MSTPEVDRPAAPSPRITGYLVRERPADGSATAFGPLLPSRDCLACFRRRREASAHAPGELSLLPLDGLRWPDARWTELQRHQLRAGHPPQPFLPPADCERRCGTVSLCVPPPPVPPVPPQPESMADDMRAMVGQVTTTRVTTTTASTPLPDVRAAIGSHTGLIGALHLWPAPDGHWTAVAQGQATPGTAGIPVLARGTATAADEHTALTLAVCEALERYCAGFWVPQALRSARPRSAAAGADAAPSGRQVAMRRLDGGPPVWIPAQRVYLPFAADGRFHDGDSVGLACGRDTDDARTRAVAELIERWVVTPWLDRLLRGRRRRRAAPTGSGTRPPHPPTLPEATSEHAWTIARVRLGRQEHHVAAAFRLQPAPPWCAMGFGCHPDPEHARQKAANEARHVQSHLHAWLVQGAAPGAAPLSGLDADLHALAFEPGVAARLLAAEPPARHTPRRHLAPGRVRWRDITTRDVQALGLAVVRAVLDERQASGSDRQA